MTEFPISTCKYPSKILVGSSFITTSCGKCSSCCHKKRTQWAEKLYHEITSCNNVIFATLTYSNKHLPLVYYSQKNKEVTCITHTKFNTDGSYRRVDITKDILNNKYSSNLQDFDFIPHFVKSRKNNKPIYSKLYNFAIPLVKDVQDFMRRLRTNIYRHHDLFDCNQEVRFFCCPEYGPETYRPHYHILLFFADPKVASVCYSHLILDSWAKHDFSSVDDKTIQYVTTAEGASQYTSKYITCDTSLPLVLQHPLFKTKYTFSKAKPIGSQCIKPTSIVNAITSHNICYKRAFKNQESEQLFVRDIPLPNTCWSRYFPRPYFLSHLSTEFISQAIDRIFELPANASIPNYEPVLRKFFELNKKKFFTVDEKSKKSNIYKITYKDILPRILESTYYIDRFLFGIPQNRTFVKKILKFRQHENLTPGLYKDLFFQFFNLKHSNNLKNLYEKYNKNHSYYTHPLQLLQEYYPETYSNLPKTLTGLLPEIRDYYDKLFTSFDFNLDDLYVNDELYQINNFGTIPYLMYINNLTSRDKSFKTKRLSNHLKFQNL